MTADFRTKGNAKAMEVIDADVRPKGSERQWKALKQTSVPKAVKGNDCHKTITAMQSLVCTDACFGLSAWHHIANQIRWKWGLL